MRLGSQLASILVLAVVSVHPVLSATEEQQREFPHGGLEEECSLCHSPRAWSPALISDQFRHENFGSPLAGSHASAECRACHLDLDFSQVETDCVSCHQDVHLGELGIDCSRCHTTVSFVERSSMLRAHRLTRFPLTGSHASESCESCHESGPQGRMVFVNRPTECAECHREDYAATTDPDHQVTGFSDDCTSCHTTTTWPQTMFGQGFNHEATGFSLAGAHRLLGCQSCHQNDVYSGLDQACSSCHQQDYDGTVSPDHQAGGFPVTCASCHTSVAWVPAAFDHNATAFPINGAHGAVDCQSCHQSGVYAGLNTDCASCHQQDYDAAVTPEHRAAGFPTTCASCHTSVAWVPADFDHNATAFPLSGAHGAVDCQSCHQSGVYAGLNTDCASCHQQDYDTAVTPDHIAAGFPVTCASCHTSVAWVPSSFNHDASAFPLTGSHRAVDCQSCHQSGVYAGLNPECVSCHQQEFDTSIDPNHVAAGFQATCDVCHNTSAWVPGIFDHGSTAFLLTGSHQAARCVDCHQSGIYAGLNQDCVFCHQQDYDISVDPDHRAANFPSTCASCHTTSAWVPADFNHDGLYFPIDSGAHRGRWSACSDCHINPSNFSLFSCTVSCHNDEAKVNDNHSEVSGYVYESQACLTCHPQGKS